MKILSRNREGLEQIAYLEWLKLQHPLVYSCTFHIANERKTTPQYGLYLQKLGVKPGVSDLFIAFPSKEFHGLFIEMKSKIGKATPKQVEFIKLMRERGYFAEVCFGAEQAIALTKDYIN